MAFTIATAVISIYLLVFEIVLYRQWKKHLGHTGWFRYIAIVYWAFVLITQLPMWSYVVLGRQAMVFEIKGSLLPIYYVYLSWQYSLAAVFPFYLAAWLLVASAGWVYLFARKKRRLSHSHSAEESIHIEEENALSRRDFFRKAGIIGLDSAPALLAAGAFSGMFLGSREIVIDEVPVSIGNLHPDLEGLRIVQISDVHVGNLINDDYLKFATDLIEPLKADFIFVTGDIIDNNNYFLKDAGRFFAQLEEKHPGRLYGILGNHDFINSGDEVATELEKAGLKFLRNQNSIIRRGRGELNLMGLDYPFPWRRERGARMRVAKKYYEQASKNVREDLPKIVLNHHPEDFRFLRDKPVDLVLSGHTHGGQFRFSQNRDSPLSFGSVAYRYYVGHYNEDDVRAQLYVNRGLGHWLPLRVGCPPEITVLELMKA